MQRDFGWAFATWGEFAVKNISAALLAATLVFAVAAPAYLAFDWIVSRARVFSVSVGTTNRLAFAWIDGTDRGHGVARFDGDAVPARGSGSGDRRETAHARDR